LAGEIRPDCAADVADAVIRSLAGHSRLFAEAAEAHDAEGLDRDGVEAVAVVVDGQVVLVAGRVAYTDRKGPRTPRDATARASPSLNGRCVT
jgi:CubicO group peptidase (beta-lactamase class C family)